MTDKLYNPDYLLSLCQKYNLRPSKKYGQNYLIDPAPIEAMIAAGEVNSQDTVVEVGPGFGVLTFALLEKAGSVVAFEIEKKIEPYWEQIKKTRNQSPPQRDPASGRWENKIEIVWGNVIKEAGVILSGVNTPEESLSVAKRDPSGVALRMTNGYKLIANLPYQITSQVIRTFLESENPPERMVLMVQKEVAERICAKPGDMSVLSIAVQYYADAEIVMQVPRSMFWPVPAVDSAIVRIKNKELRIKDDDFVKRFFQLVKIGFANRRKLLFKNLLPFVGKKNSDALRAAFAGLGLDPSRVRAQELGVEKWVTLCKTLNSKP